MSVNLVKSVKCQTMGCNETAVFEMGYTYRPDADSTTRVVSDDVCRECAEGYCRRAALTVHYLIRIRSAS